MGFYHNLVFSATITGDVRKKEARFNKQNMDYSLPLELDEQPIPLGNKQTKAEKCNYVWVSYELTKERDMTLKKGDRVLVNARLTGSSKDGKAPAAYYLKASEVELLTQARSINQFFGKGKVDKIVECAEIPGTMKLLCKEPKRSYGNTKPDYKTSEGWHFYICIANMILDTNIYKPGEYFYFTGRMAKGIFPVNNALSDEQKKRLNSPVILLEKALY
jgi:hypothetical protein